MDITVKWKGTDMWPPSEQTYVNVTYTKDKDWEGENGVQKGVTLNVWEDENANGELEPGELRATYAPGTWDAVTEI